MGSVRYLFSGVPVADRAAGTRWFEAIAGDEALWQVGDTARVVVDEHAEHCALPRSLSAAEFGRSPAAGGTPVPRHR